MSTLPCVNNYTIGSIININNIYYELIYDIDTKLKKWIIDEDYNNLNYDNNSSDDEQCNNYNINSMYKNLKINFDNKKKKNSMLNILKNDTSSNTETKLFIIKEKKPRGRPPKISKISNLNIQLENKEPIVLKKVVKKINLVK